MTPQATSSQITADKETTPMSTTRPFLHATCLLLLSATLAPAQFGGFELIELPPDLQNRSPEDYTFVSTPPVSPSTQVVVHSLAPEGKAVKTGEIIGEIQITDPKQQEAVERTIREKQPQLLATQSTLDSSTRDLELAEIQLREYVEGLYPLEEQILEGQVKLAESDLILAEQEFKAADMAKDQPEIALLKLKTNLLRTQLKLREAESRLKVSREYTKQRRIRELQSNVEKIRNQARINQSLYDLEKEALEALAKRLEGRTQLIAPRDGTVRRLFKLDDQPRTAQSRSPLLVIVVAENQPQAPDTEKP